MRGYGRKLIAHRSRRGFPYGDFKGAPTVIRRSLGERPIVKLILSIAIGLVFPVNNSDAQPATRVTAVSASAVRIPVARDSRLWLEGSSNVRDWTCRATEMDASIEADVSAANPVVRSVVVSVPVRTLKCGDKHMEAHLYTALKAPPAPEISFITARFDRLPPVSTTGELVETAGRLSIAGIERPVTMSVRSERLSDGSYRARGTVPMLMTDFGIKPPRPWRGILRTADKVLVQFEIFVRPAS